MGKKGGGGADTSGLERATEEATALQKMIYEQSREDVQPWYQAGKGSIGKLSDLLGISGGSVQDRQGIYDELLPQYTTQQTTGGADSNFVRAPNGTLLDLNNEQALQQYKGWQSGVDDPAMRMMGSTWNPEDFTDQYGFQRLGSQPQTSESINYDALNTAVEERLGNQATPEGYGSLLERFDLSKFEEDPSYQFRQDQGNKALERAMAAQGVTLGGGGYGEVNPQVARALQEQNQNLASQEYGNAYNRYENDQNSIFNRLMGVAGMGQGSTGQMQQGGQSYATNVGNLTTGLASAQQQAALANQSQGGSMFGQILGAVAPAAIGAFTGGAGLGLGAFSGGAAGVGASGAMNPSQWSSFLARN